MDKGTWIAIAIMIAASIGVFMLQAGGGPDMNASTSGSNTPAATSDVQNNTAPAPATNDPECQAAAAAAATNEQTTEGVSASVVKAHFNQSLQQCYYELDLFVSSGNETDIRVAPDDQKVASCVTTTTDSILCQDQAGSTITEPQFKSLLTKYLAN